MRSGMGEDLPGSGDRGGHARRAPLQKRGGSNATETAKSDNCRKMAYFVRRNGPVFGPVGLSGEIKCKKSALSVGGGLRMAQFRLTYLRSKCRFGFV